MNSNNKYWNLLIKLSEIINILYSNVINDNDLTKLEMLIKAHHGDYKMLYPTVSLKKKHHNMVHYPTAIRKIGSLVDYCTLRFEGKHAVFKTAHHTSHNNKTIPKTVAKQHQITLANSLINSNLLNKDLIVLNGKDVIATNLNLQLKLRIKEIFEFSENDIITVASEIEYYGQVYKKNYVVAKLNDEKLFFYSILHILIHKVIYLKFFFTDIN